MLVVNLHNYTHMYMRHICQHLTHLSFIGVQQQQYTPTILMFTPLHQYRSTKTGATATEHQMQNIHYLLANWKIYAYIQIWKDRASYERNEVLRTISILACCFQHTYSYTHTYILKYKFIHLHDAPVAHFKKKMYECDVLLWKCPD